MLPSVSVVLSARPSDIDVLTYVLSVPDLELSSALVPSGSAGVSACDVADPAELQPNIQYVDSSPVVGSENESQGGETDASPLKRKRVSIRCFILFRNDCGK